MMEEKYFCTNCLKFKTLVSTLVKETFCIESEIIQINSQYLKCNCGELMYDPKNINSNYELAYNEYRKKMNILFPKQIIELRNKYNLSQGKFSKLLGWDKSTLVRYEKGALLSKEHNLELLLLQEKIINN